MDSFGTLLGSTFMPHGFCLRWLPGLLWTHVVADALIAIAYFSIPISILYYLSRRSTRGEAEGQSEMVQRYWWIGVMFAAFILCCGITHIFGMVTIWQPVYGLQALLKAVTAVVSLLTAAALIRMTPQLLALRTAEELEAEISRRQERETELERANARLRNEMASRQRAEDAERAAVRAFRELEESLRGGGLQGEDHAPASIAALDKQLLLGLTRAARQPARKAKEASTQLARSFWADLPEEPAPARQLRQALDGFGRVLTRYRDLAGDLAHDPLRHIALAEYFENLHAALQDTGELGGLDFAVELPEGFDVMTNAGSLSVTAVSLLQEFQGQAGRGRVLMRGERAEDGVRLRFEQQREQPPGNVDELEGRRREQRLRALRGFVGERLSGTLLASSDSQGNLILVLELPQM